MIDLTTISDKLIVLDDGTWTTPDHIDLAFLSDEAIDWAQVEENSFWYRHRNRCLAEILKHFPPIGTLFEIGAGNGIVSLWLQKQGISIVAIEPTMRMAHHAKRRGVNYVIGASLESARIKEGTLDNVGMFDVLEHISDDECYLKQVRRTMPIAGRFYCSVPSYSFLWSLEDQAAGHVQRYNLSNLCRKINRSGFEIEYASYYFVALIFPILLLRAIPSWFHLRKKRTHQTTMHEHQPRSRWIASILERTLDWELEKILKREKLWIGSSCFAVARAV